jgi:ferredoxin-NADP reductase/predicted pyridoxine 5'-phosphate oxidase superfamily flavin-nucleotide-binding protein
MVRERAGAMDNPEPRKLTTPWHAGEIAIQRSVGVVDRMDTIGRKYVRPYLLDEHREFFAQLPFVVLGTVDNDGNPWACVRCGEAGFAVSPDEHRLTVRVGRDLDDPAEQGIKNGAAIGLLGIDLYTRRRNRLNGIIARDNDTAFAIAVQASFGNCPQYIQKRIWHDAPVAVVKVAEQLAGLDAAARGLIGRADTFFVASYVDLEDGSRQVDVSHRGGKAGFVRLAADDRLTIPDFAGNLFFNTLGNLFINPRAGLLFIDFETGDTLQLSGAAEVVLQSPDIADFQGAERLWHFRPERAVRRPAAFPYRWEFKEWSPNVLLTGSWEDAARRQAAQERAEQWRPFRVARIVDESVGIKSFYLEPADGAGPAVHEAGQYLPIRLTVPDQARPLVRTYTLSSAPSDDSYRITVKRQGAASVHLHDTVKPGDLIEARAPLGKFTIDPAEQRPAVLISAGVGVTPMIAMLRHLAYEGHRTRRTRPTWFFNAAHSLAERPFSAEIDELVAAGQGAIQTVRVLGTTQGARPDVDFDVEGRIDVALLKAHLPFDDYDFYLCGPPGFTQALYDGLRDLNVSDLRIHAEAFGPAALSRKVDLPTQASAVRASERPATVVFIASSKEARWSPGDGSLLELAEARGLNPEYGCRSGSCGTCHTKVLKGQVAYLTPVSASIPTGEALICCAVPAAQDDDAQAPLMLDL